MHKKTQLQPRAQNQLRGDSFPFDFDPNGIPFGSKSKGKLSLLSYPIQCERKSKYNFLSVIRNTLK